MKLSAPDDKIPPAASAGEALRIERTGGRALMIIMNDPGAAAALLNPMAERAR